MMFKSVMSVVALVASLANGAALDVFVPPITDPKTGTIWQVGSQFNVTWDISNAPAQITNSEGTIALAQGGKIFDSQPGGLQHPLASGFNILLGQMVVSVPDVPSGDNYQIVLFGDSGNFSPEFTIQ